MKTIDKVKSRLYIIPLVLVVLILASIPISIAYKIHEETQLANKPVDVLTNWSICTAEFDSQNKCVDTNIYHPGDTIHVTSHFDKLADITGESTRYIQCRKPAPKNDQWDGEYQANKIPATQPKTKNGVATYTIGIPLNPGTLPNTCRLHIVTTYNVNKYHPRFQEYIYSNEFTVEPIDLSGKTIIYTDDANASDALRSVLNLPDENQPIIIYQRNPSLQPNQTVQGQTPNNQNNNSEEENSPPTGNNQPNVVQQIVTGVTDGVTNIVNGITGIF